MNFNNNFICYDGENKGKNYFLLGNSKEYIFCSSGLSSRKCLSFITKPQKKKRIIFNLHYDLQFWIKDFSDSKILNLLNGYKVKYYEYELQYFSKKMLIIRKNNSIFKIYDILSFFKLSLLNTIEKLQIELTEQEKYILNIGKVNRSFNFDKMTKEEIILYNKTECIISEKIASKIYLLLFNSLYKDKKGKTENLTITNFFGASAIASKLLRSYNVHKLKKHNKYFDIFESAYYGGRFEVLKIGTFKNVYKYDINSAYPSIIKDLREVKKFTKWKKGNSILDDGIYKIYYKQYFPNDFICPFPLRHKTGRIFYSGEITGYYFGCEVNSLLKSGCNTENYELKILSGIEPLYIGKYIFDNKEGNLIKQLYEQRKIFKQKKDLRHYIYKITLNSIYGKFAQRIGSTQFQNLYYAGYITAKVRSILLEESYKVNYNSILCYATDSIISTQKLKVKTGYELGFWEYEQIKEANILMSGFYRLKNNKEKFYYGLRGFNATGKQFDKILYEVKKKGKSKIKLSQFIGHKLAIKDYKVYKDKRLLFIPIEKIIDIKNGNFKRKYIFNNFHTSLKSSFHTFEQIESVKIIKKDFPDFFIDY